MRVDQPRQEHDIFAELQGVPAGQAAAGQRLGVPAVALAGAGGVICLGALMVLFITNKSISTQFAVTAHLSVEFMLGVVAAGVLWYVGALLYNRRRGVNLNLAYKEIPPE